MAMNARDRSAAGMLLWYAGGVVAAILVGWLAAWIHSHARAPVGITSMGVGMALGAALSAVAVKLRVVARPAVVGGAVVLALITVLAEHGWLYREFRRQWHEARGQSPHVAMFRDQSPWSARQYFTHEASPRRIALWCVDVALITASAAGTVWWLRRRALGDSASRPTLNPLTPDT